jgi:hypothetical protein
MEPASAKLVVVESTTSRSFLAASMKSSRVAELDTGRKPAAMNAALRRKKTKVFIVDTERDDIRLPDRASS